MTPRLSLFVLAALACTGVGGARAQALPTSQPGLITIIREQVKIGRNVEHARIEAGWPAAFARANSPTTYLAFTSLTGVNEAWFVVPYASHAAIAEDLRRTDADTTLSAELARLSRADAEVLNDIRTLQAVARPDLSWGAFPDLAKQRFWEITIFRVRPGHETEFDAAAKAYGSASQRSGSTTTFRVYEVIAGMVGPTYIVFSSVPSYADFDQMMANGRKTMQAATPEEMGALQKFSTDAALNVETNRFRLDPTMSYVSRETRATDPAFWMPRRPARRP